MRKLNSRFGFTLTELIITIVLMGIIMIPLGLIALEFMRNIPYARDLGVATALAKTELAKINNLGFSDPASAVGYDNVTAGYEGYPYDLRRTVTAGPAANLKQVQVRVYPAGNTTNHLINLITYVANVSFGTGSGGGTAGDAADFLLVSAGNIHKKQLRQVTLENTDTDQITITGVIISFTGGTNLTSIQLDGNSSWSGTANSGDTVTLINPFTLAGETTYKKSSIFEFSSNLTSLTSLVFIMDDASQSEAYSW